MRKYAKFKLVLLALLVWAPGVVTRAQAVTPPAAPARPLELKTLPGVSVTVLVDNMAGGGPVLGEWGLALLIETEARRVLLDTGEGRVVLGNARALEVDLGKVDAIVISHGHRDHTAGLETVLRVTGPVGLYLHPDAFTTRYWREGSGALKLGMPLSREQLRGRVREIVDTKGPTLVADGVMVTGRIPRVSDFEDTGVRGYAFLDEGLTIPDQVPEDQALFFRVPEGVVVVLGCGHAGLVNTMRYVADLLGERKVYAVMGGTHLISASPARLARTIEALRSYDVQKIMLSHCTGVRAYAEVARAFPDRCSWPGSGTRVRFGRP